MLRGFLLNVLILSFLAIVLGGGTLAIFTDTETSQDNAFAAGTLDLKVNGSDDPNVPNVYIGDVKPGDSGVIVFEVSNAGSLDGTLNVTIENVVNYPGLTPEPEEKLGADLGELGDHVLIDICYEYAGSETCAVTGATLNSLNGITYVLGDLDAGSTGYVKIYWNIPSETGNEIQGDEVTFDVRFGLVQK